MAAPGKAPAAGSRWGSFLTSAVTSVESRLDNMLAEAGDDEQQQQQQSKPTPQPPPPQQQSAAPKPIANQTRSNSNSRTNDRLQARLAKAMAGKQSSPRGSVDVLSPASSTRPSMDQEAREKEEVAVVTPAEEKAPPEMTPPMSIPIAKAPEPEKTVEEASTPPAVDSVPQQDSPNEQPEISKSSTPAPTDNESTTEAAADAPPTTQQTEDQASSKDMEELKAQHQEELQEQVERIDSLQSKLQYLSRNSAIDAKKAAQAAPSGSADRKIAERDEKIALLMEEGQKLSINEQKFRTTLRKLRSQMADHEKQMEELRKSKDKAVIEADALKKRIGGSEEKQKREDEAKKATAGLQKEIDVLKKERTAKDEAFKKLEQELRTQREKNEAANAEAYKKELAAEQEKQKGLEDTIARLQSEQELLSDKSRQESVEWGEKLERAAERSKNMEAELKHELRTMESKLEAMRMTAEEASSGSGGEAQVGLLRQMETLQTQYSTAGENWRGIEASLLAKVSNLEKERDEAQRRESEMRKKARDAASKNRRLEDDLQDMQPTLATAQQELETYKDQISALQKSNRTAETALEQARTDLEKQQRAGPRDVSENGDRRQQWVDDQPGSRVQSRPDSPLLSVPRTFSSDLIGFQIPGRPRRSPAPGSIPDSSGEGLGFPLPRRQSSQPPVRHSGLSNGGSQPPPSPFSPFMPPSETHNFPLTTPSVMERDDPADDFPLSPRNVAQDMISVSTVGAGPSVQLVERMSSAIRRLEGEKVAAKEEMARVCSQRNEARTDMVGLMKQVEEAKTAGERVPGLEKEVESLNQRYQTTLELLGEKSELVEELKADVQDVKDMYRELVQRVAK